MRLCAVWCWCLLRKSQTINLNQFMAFLHIYILGDYMHIQIHNVCWFRKSFLIMARTIKSLRNPHEVPITSDCLWPPSPFWRTPRSFPSFLDQRFWQTDSSRQASVALTCEFPIQTLRDKHLFIIPTSFI